MALTLVFLYLIHSFAPMVAPPANRLAGLIRDGTPGRLATAAIEGSVSLSNKTGLGFLEHAALAALSVVSHLVFLAAGGIAALVIGAAGSEVRAARRGLAATALAFLLFCLLGARPQGLGVFSVVVYAGGAFAFGRTAAARSLFRIAGPKLRSDETPLDALRRSRRRFLRRAAIGLGGAVAGGAFIRRFTGPDGPSVRIASADEPFAAPPRDPAFDKITGLSKEITPTEDFYNVDINISKPSVDHVAWRLKIDGLVERPMELTYLQLQNQFPVVEMASTLSCISNEVGGDLVSTAVWRGVRLGDVLSAAGLKAGAVELIFRAADGYSDSVPLETGMRDDTLVAFGMNGEALPRDNGFPARMVIPGIYGMKNVKWLTGIEVAAENYRGYWQKRGWSDAARVKTQSRIDVPAAGTASVGGILAGVAWAGDRRITRVEVSEDGGKTWRPATLKRELAPNSWRLWAAHIMAGPGRRKFVVRAADGEGRLQQSNRTRTHPDGASGLHSISVKLNADGS